TASIDDFSTFNNVYARPRGERAGDAGACSEPSPPENSRRPGAVEVPDVGSPGSLQTPAPPARSAQRQAMLIGCDFGSTTAKAVALSHDRELLFSCYALSKGNPIEDAQSLFAQLREAGFDDVAGLALTGYGKDLLRD